MLLGMPVRCLRTSGGILSHMPKRSVCLPPDWLPWCPASCARVGGGHPINRGPSASHFDVFIPVCALVCIAPTVSQEGYRIVQGPNESFKAFVTHEWQTATAEAIGPSLDEAWAAFPTFSLPPRAGESADDVANEGQPAVLIGSDGGSIEIPAQATWMLCQLRPVLRGCTAPIKVAQLPAAVLGKVRDFCVQHHGDSRAELTEEQEILLRETPIAAWDKEFVDVDLQTLFELILAANYLNIKAMQNLTCKAVAEMIKGKSPEDIKKLFGVEGDFTEEEKAQVLAENPWLREDNEVEPPLAEEENPWLE